MCGIVGIASNEPIKDIYCLDIMRDTMHHRGPDSAGSWWNRDYKVGLGHRRLSIIDLSALGHQPMLDNTGNFILVFNGEIFNHLELRIELSKNGAIFKGRSDTEVIIEAYKLWGKECVKKFNGMFAFALYDMVKQQVFIARDRAGQKPLFYYQKSNKLLFASELKALMSYPNFEKKLDPVSLNFYFTYGYIPKDRCILENVKKLPAAHAMLFDINSSETKIWKYWSLPVMNDNQKFLSKEELLEKTEFLLTDATKLRLVADVPVGVLLSGGLDSSLITALAAKSSEATIKTFTMIFPGYGKYDEGPFARQISKYFNTEHHELEVKGNAVEILPLLAEQYDEPIADSSMLPVYLISKLVKEHVTVALGGDGGDELFGGYEHYSLIQKMDNLRRFSPSFVRKAIAYGAERIMHVGVKGRNHLIGYGKNTDRSLAHINIYFDKYARKKLLSNLDNNFINWFEPESQRISFFNKDMSALQNATMIDFKNTMAEAYLVKVDRASMLNSLEMRSPFLDHRLIEFAFSSLPDRLRADEVNRKIMLRALGDKLLPKDFNKERKQGFSLPLDSWFSGEWGDYVKDILKNADRNIFNQEYIQYLLKKQSKGYANSQRIFAITIFELWRKRYNVSL